MIKPWQLWILAILAVASVGVWVLAIATYREQRAELTSSFDAMMIHCTYTRHVSECTNNALELYMNENPLLIECWRADDYRQCGG